MPVTPTDSAPSPGSAREVVLAQHARLRTLLASAEAVAGRYRAGDPVKHIIWRSYARSEQLMVKRYSSYVEPRLWLDLDLVSGDLEEKISRLTGLALKASRLEREFGLRLGHLTIKPALGDAHLEQILRELAELKVQV